MAHATHVQHVQPTGPMAGAPSPPANHNCPDDDFGGKINPTLSPNNTETQTTNMYSCLAVQETPAHAITSGIRRVQALAADFVPTDGSTATSPFTNPPYRPMLIIDSGCTQAHLTHGGTHVPVLSTKRDLQLSLETVGDSAARPHSATVIETTFTPNGCAPLRCEAVKTDVPLLNNAILFSKSLLEDSTTLVYEHERVAFWQSRIYIPIVRYQGLYMIPTTPTLDWSLQHITGGPDTTLARLAHRHHSKHGTPLNPIDATAIDATTDNATDTTTSALAAHPATAAPPMTLRRLHDILNHADYDKVSTAAQHLGIPLVNRRRDICIPCMRSRATPRRLEPLPDRTRVPINGPREQYVADFKVMPPTFTGYNGEKTILVIVDEYSRYTMVSPIRSKSDAVGELDAIITRFGAPTNILFDGESFFYSDAVKKLASTHKISISHTSPYHHEQLGVAERHIGILMPQLRAVYAAAAFQTLAFLPFAVRHCAYVGNTIPSKRDGVVVSPYKLFHGVDPSPQLRYMGAWGELVMTTRHSRGNNKLSAMEPRRDTGVFIGVSDEPPGRPISFLILVPDGTPRPPIRRCHVADVVWTGKPGGPYVQQQDPYQPSVQHAHQHDLKQFLLATTLRYTDPAWYPPYDTEFGAWVHFRTFRLPRPDESTTPLTYLSIKENTKRCGRDKVRPVVGGDKIPSPNKKDCWSPMLCAQTSATMLALAANFEMHIALDDASNAYLHCRLPKPIYIRTPHAMQYWIQRKGFEYFQQNMNLTRDEYDRLCNAPVLAIDGALYGHDTSGRLFSEFMTKTNKAIHMTQSAIDPCLYFDERIPTPAGKPKSMAGWYVDDCESIYHNKPEQEKYRQDIKKHVKIGKTQEPPDDVLGVQRTYNPIAKTITLHCTDKIEALCRDFGLDPRVQFQTPMQTSRNLTPTDDDEPVTKEQCHLSSILGTAAWICERVMFECLFAVNALRIFQNTPTVPLVRATEQLLAYMLANRHRGSTSRKTNIPADNCITAFVDASRNTPTTGRCHGCTLIYVFQSLVDASVKAFDKTLTPDSAGSAEYQSLQRCAKRVYTMRLLLQEMGLRQTAPSTIYIDCIPARDWGNNGIKQRENRHLNFKPKYDKELDRYNFERIRTVKELIDMQQIRLVYIRSEVNPADIGTKALPATTFLFLRDMIYNPTFLQSTAKTSTQDLAHNSTTSMTPRSPTDNESSTWGGVCAGPPNEPTGAPEDKETDRKSSDWPHAQPVTTPSHNDTSIARSPTQPANDRIPRDDGSVPGSPRKGRAS